MTTRPTTDRRTRRSWRERVAGRWGHLRVELKHFNGGVVGQATIGEIVNAEPWYLGPLANVPVPTYAAVEMAVKQSLGHGGENPYVRLLAD